MTKRCMYTQAIEHCVSGDYGFLFDSCCAVVCLQINSMKNIKSIDKILRQEEEIFKCGFSFIHPLLPLSDVCRDQQQNMIG